MHKNSGANYLFVFSSCKWDKHWSNETLPYKRTLLHGGRINLPIVQLKWYNNKPWKEQVSVSFLIALFKILKYRTVWVFFTKESTLCPFLLNPSTPSPIILNPFFTLLSNSFSVSANEQSSNFYYFLIVWSKSCPEWTIALFHLYQESFEFTFHFTHRKIFRDLASS